MSKLKIAVLISGRGTNLQSLIDACQDPAYPAEIVLVLSNKASAYGLDRAKAADLATLTISHKDYDSRDAFDGAIDDALQAAGVQLVCLAGFMRLLTANFVGRWKDRMINIHPSLLPSFKGLDTHERALEAGVRFAGCTLHYVRAEMDDGPILSQAAVPVLPDDTPDTLAARVLEVENQLYPEAVKLIAEGKVRVSGGKVIISADGWATTPIMNPPLSQ